MFRLSLATANDSVVKRWLIVSGVATGTPGVVTIASLTKIIGNLIPKEYVNSRYVTIALIIGFVTGLSLALFKKVLCVSFAQLGAATSAVYLGFALTGAFQPEFRAVITAIVVMLDLVFLVLFSSGLSFMAKQRSPSDVALGILLLLIFLSTWLWPIWVMWRKQ